MKRATTTAKSKSFSIKHAICIQTLHCSVRFIICGMALYFSAIIYYGQASLIKKKLKKIFYICHLNHLLSFKLKPEVDTSLEKISLENGLINLYCVLSNMATLNKTHATILVFAAGDLQKYWIF